jgi:UDP-GlcNAc3NAcA epimerase
MLTGLEPVLRGERPDLVLVYGDTNSTLAGALVAAKLGLRLGHVESGLRSFDRAMPEEVNRVVADVVSDLRFCPSQTAVANLAAEGITAGVHLVGDVMVDVARTFGPAARRTGVVERLGLEQGGYALVTVHRQSNTSAEAMPALVEVLETVGQPAVFPIHPRTRAALEAAGLLGRAEAAATLTPPLGYLEFTGLLVSAGVCLTDSGGVQKEAYLHSVPCITLRDTSEWLETIELGWNRLSGGLDAAAVATALATLDRPAAHPPLYGDGDASARIAEVVAASPLASWPP